MWISSTGQKKENLGGVLMSNKVLVIEIPTIEEIETVLDCVSLSHDLRYLVPKFNGSRAEFLKAGWCYLFYDEEKLVPLGYLAFSFSKIKGKPPELLFAMTQFLKPIQFLIITRMAMKICSKLGTVCAQMVDDKIIKMAKALGFNKVKGNWYGWRR